MSQFHITIIQQGVAPKVVEAAGTLAQTLRNEGIDTEEFVILRGGAPADLYSPIVGDMTVTATKKSVGAHDAGSKPIASEINSRITKVVAYIKGFVVD